SEWWCDTGAEPAPKYLSPPCDLQSVNEELQSANEELETSKEEMQSINEELQTASYLRGLSEVASSLAAFTPLLPSSAAGPAKPFTADPVSPSWSAAFMAASDTRP